MPRRLKAPFLILQAALVLFAWLLPGTAWSQCVCGFSDGQFTSAPITLDGNMGDWAAVHADPDNNVCDGPGNGLVDADNPQSLGRDLTHFAFTYDNTNLYLFTARSGPYANVQTFVYYADIDNDGLMETGEPVIGAVWRGSNRRVEVFTMTYVAAVAGGDVMTDAGGQADGYSLPGSFANRTSVRAGAWGSADGEQVEFRVTWAELGIAPNTPFTFHVSSSNAALTANSFAAQIDDNLSGCGGGIGTMVQPALSFSPDRNLIGLIGQAATGVHTLRNDGNADDTFNLASVASGDYTPVVSYYFDSDASGGLSLGDVALTDTDGDAAPDTGVLAPTATVTLLIVHAVPAGLGDALVATVVSTASSAFRPAVAASVTDTITTIAGPDLLVLKTGTTLSDPVNGSTNPKAIPGATVAYQVTVSNQGVGAVDTDTFAVLDPVPSDGCLVVTDIAGAGSGPVAFSDGTPSSGLTYTFLSLGSATDDLAFSSDGGASFGYTPVPDASGCDAAVTHIDISPKGQFAADSGAGSPAVTFAFRVIIN